MTQMGSPSHQLTIPVLIALFVREDLSLYPRLTWNILCVSRVLCASVLRKINYCLKLSKVFN